MQWWKSYEIDFCQISSRLESCLRGKRLLGAFKEHKISNYFWCCWPQAVQVSEQLPVSANKNIRVQIPADIICLDHVFGQHCLKMVRLRKTQLFMREHTLRGLWASRYFCKISLTTKLRFTDPVQKCCPRCLTCLQKRNIFITPFARHRSPMLSTRPQIRR